MSLINDLLIELEEHRSPKEQGRDELARGLQPRARKPRSGWTSRTGGLAVMTCLTFAAAGLSWVLTSPGSPSPPPVDARPATTTAEAPDPPTPAEHAPLRIHRPSTVRALTVETRDGLVRLRIETDGPAVHRLERSSDGERVDLILDGAELGSSLTPLDLVETPIRSLATLRRDAALHVALELDRGTRVRSQSVEGRDGATILLDLHAQSSDAPKTRNRRTPDASPANPPIVRGTPAAEEEQVVEIAPSLAERGRMSREAARERAQAELAAARTARDRGEIDAAEQHYRGALEHDPTHRDALVEWAMLLRDDQRVGDAVDLVQRAHSADRESPQLVLLLARLLEDAGRRGEAIAALDALGASLTEAPRVHALAAAFLQRDGRHDEAAARYEAIVRRYPGESRWWLGLGISLDALSRGAEAADVFRIAMQLGTLPRASRQWVSARIEQLDEEG